MHTHRIGKLLEAVPVTGLPLRQGAYLDRKITLWFVQTRATGDLVGALNWTPSLRDYVFAPVPGVYLTRSCLAGLAVFVDDLMVKRAAVRERGVPMQRSTKPTKKAG